MAMDPAWYWHSLLLALVVAAQNQLTSGQKGAETLSLCGTKELCVTEQRCRETDDSGRSAIVARLARTCGDGLVCCDREQLESWDAVQGTANRLTEPDAVTEEPSGYESCGQDLECVPRKLCRDNVIIDDGRHILNARIGDLPCRRALHRCCAVNQRITVNESSYTEKLANFRYRGCGHSNAQGLIPDEDNYEYQTDTSLFAEFPWMVALITGRNHYLCGGTLIHPQLVLTSAHNIRNHTVDTLVARTGEWDLNSLEEPYKHQSRRIKQIIPHEDFDPEAHYNDIALLVLDAPVAIQPHIQPLCLPPPETPQLQTELRSALCYATGWGGRLPDSNSNERLLKRIDLPIVSKSECQGLLRVTRLGRRFRLRPSFLCAGGIKDKDTCKGDGGSPLFCTLPGQAARYRLAGVVSWGVDCAKQDVPAVYANVPYLRSWIDGKAKSLGFDLEAH